MARAVGKCGILQQWCGILQLELCSLAPKVIRSCKE